MKILYDNYDKELKEYINKDIKLKAFLNSEHQFLRFCPWCKNTPNQLFISDNHTQYNEIKKPESFIFMCVRKLKIKNHKKEYVLHHKYCRLYDLYGSLIWETLELITADKFHFTIHHHISGFKTIIVVNHNIVKKYNSYILPFLNRHQIITDFKKIMLLL